MIRQHPVTSDDHGAHSPNVTLGNLASSCLERNCPYTTNTSNNLLVNLTSCSNVMCDSDCNFWCDDSLKFNSGKEGAMFTVGNVISLLCLFVTFVTYCTFAELRRSNNGKFLLNLIGALFLAKLAFQINPLFTGLAAMCSVMALFQHYFCLAAFLWSNIITFNLWRDVQRSPADWSPHSHNAMYPVYLCYAWGLPLTVVVACSVIEFMEDLSFHYGNREHCGVLGDDALVYSLAVPLVIITLTNIGFFMLIVYKPHIRSRLFSSKLFGGKSNQTEEIVLYERSSSIMAPTDEANSGQYGSTQQQPKETKTVNPGCLYNDTRTTNARTTSSSSPSIITTSTLSPTRSRPSPQEEALQPVHEALAKLVWVFAKMAVLMSFAWLAGFLAVLTQTYPLWLIFTLLNAMQGVFIFVSFTLSPPAADLIKQWWKVNKKKRSRRSRYKKFEDRYSNRPPQPSEPAGNIQTEQTAVIVPSVAEITV